MDLSQKTIKELTFTCIKAETVTAVKGSQGTKKRASAGSTALFNILGIKNLGGGES